MKIWQIYFAYGTRVAVIQQEIAESLSIKVTLGKTTKVKERRTIQRTRKAKATKVFSIPRAPSR